MVETRRKKAANKEGVTTRGAQELKMSTEPKRLDAVDKQTSGASKAKTFAEVAKSPRLTPTKKRSGFKPQIPKAEGQQTLEEAFQAGALYQEAKEIKKKALMAKDEIEISSDEETEASSSDSSEMTSTTTVSSTSTATSSSDESSPGPSKRPRVSKKVKKAIKKSPKKEVKPSKILAKTAKKKNDKKCKRSILKHVKEAQKVVSENCPDMEKECKKVEKNLDSWKEKGVETEALQRYVGRIMKKVKELNVIVVCDHAVFLKEVGLISLLEMDLVGTLNDTGPITPELAKVKANSLLELVIDTDCRNRIQQSWDGMAWRIRSETDNVDNENTEIVELDSTTSPEPVETPMEIDTQNGTTKAVVPYTGDQLQNDVTNDLNQEQNKALDLNPSSESDSEGELQIEEIENASAKVRKLLLEPSTDPTVDPTSLHSIEVGDPQGIKEDLEELLRRRHDPWIINVLKKLNRRAIDTKIKLSNLDTLVGPQVSSTDYFLNGTPEPSTYHENHSMGENILGLKNSILRNRKSLDSHVKKATKDSELIWNIINDLKNRPSNAVPKADFEKLTKRVANELVKTSSLSQGTAFNTIDLSARMVEIENSFKKLGSRLEATSKTVGLLKKATPVTADDKDTLTSIRYGLNDLKERLKKLEEEKESEPHSRNLFEESTVESSITLLQSELAELKRDTKLDLASSEVNRWLNTKLLAFMESPEFMDKLKMDSKYRLTNWSITESNLSTNMRQILVKDAEDEIRKQALKVFEEQKTRMRSYYQEGLLRAEDAPSEMNMTKTRESISLELKAEMKTALEIFSTTIMDCLTGIEKIFLDPINLNESELKTMDLILGSRLILKFFTGLSNSEEGLMKIVEDLRIWECSAPTVKKDGLNTLIMALKALKEPVTVGMVSNILREGLPSRLDKLLDHMTEITSKTLGPVEVITVAPWQTVSSRSSLECEISDTTLVDPTPVATSSKSQLKNSGSNEDSIRSTLEKLKSKIRVARKEIGNHNQTN